MWGRTAAAHAQRRSPGTTSELTMTMPTVDDQQARARRLLVVVGARLNEQLGEIVRDLRTIMATEIHELAEDPRLIDLLGASVEGNLDTIFHIVQHDIAAPQYEPPAAAIEYARRLAQRGVPVNALVRAYRLGQEHLLRWSFDVLARQGEEPELALIVSQRIVSITFTYVDWISQQIVTVYEIERERWLENRNTVRAARIRELIDGKDIELDTAEAALGYPLRQNHLGLILWLPEESAVTNKLAHLEQAASSIGRGLRCPRRPLFAPCDRTSGWAWLPLGSTRPATDTLTDFLHDSQDVRVALGGVASGVAGFRATHEEAAQAQRVAVIAGPDATRVTSFTQPGVRAAALLSTDLRQTKTLVKDVLGPLAADDPNHARLRETLLTFLSTGGSYTTTAELLSMHKNSVKYRVARAQEERGRSIGDDRLDVELALIACRWLGRTVLA